MWMVAVRPCPPVRDDIVTPPHLFYEFSISADNANYTGTHSRVNLPESFCDKAGHTATHVGGWVGAVIQKPLITPPAFLSGHSLCIQKGITRVNMVRLRFRQWCFSKQLES